MLGQRARPVRRAGMGKPTPETVHGVPSPTQHTNLDKKGAKLLFQIFTEREERKATAVATNSPFAEWDKTFGDRRLCAAIADRITFRCTLHAARCTLHAARCTLHAARCTLIQTGTESYRFQSTEADRQATARS
ncbi:ATP-binding protein [Streptomyces sp. NBC_00893]|uniref:ATP-binding protein n=1 Tax=Streptomyces sp. NBC_00893 TaxID=2975862 RepID=UPI002B1E75D6|nr:ATP-binding protein [Streptomyces sp. NBC_00893]